jgi:hypothetical protein
LCLSSKKGNNWIGVSHSVSRGVPSSNAARGTVTSSCITTSSSFNLFIYISINIIIFQKFSSKFYNIICNLAQYICILIYFNFLIYTHIFLNSTFLNNRICNKNKILGNLKFINEEQYILFCEYFNEIFNKVCFMVKNLQVFIRWG